MISVAKNKLPSSIEFHKSLRVFIPHMKVNESLRLIKFRCLILGSYSFGGGAKLHTRLPCDSQPNLLEPWQESSGLWERTGLSARLKTHLSLVWRANIFTLSCPVQDTLCSLNQSLQSANSLIPFSVLVKPEVTLPTEKISLENPSLAFRLAGTCVLSKC